MSDLRHQWRLALTNEDSPATATQRLVGLVLAEYANRESGLAWPAVSTIAGRSGLGDRAVRIALKRLVELRFLDVEREGKGTTTTFRLVRNPGTSCRTTPAAGADPPRHLTTLTPAPRSATPARRADEPLIRGKNLATVETAPPNGARSTTVCDCGVGGGRHTVDCEAAA